MNRTLSDVRRTPLLVGHLAVGLAATLGACGDDGPPAGPDAAIPFDRRALLAHVADDFVIPINERFVTESAALKTAIDGHCAALGAGGDTTASLTTARAAWVTAMDTWEEAETMLVGPAARTDNTIRNRIYGWPLVAPCTIDNDAVKRWNNPGNYDVGAVFDSARSLAAVEYLLYYTADASSCPAAPIGWEALGANRAKARCGLAGAIAADVAAQAVVLRDMWLPTGGNYRDQLVKAGTTASSIESEREAVNMVSDALFYYDRMVWDMKVREPGGLKPNACGAIQAPCLREVEHRFANHGTSAIRINLRGLRANFTGSGDVEGPGFDDYIVAVGAEAVATRLTGEIDLAITLADALPEDYNGGIATEHEKWVALSDALRTLNTDFKTSFLTVLSLDIPEEIAGDND